MSCTVTLVKESVLSSKRIATHTLLNLSGLVLPLLVAVFTYPLLTEGLGAPRFGALTLIWALAGYAGILDLGLGRALTQIASRYLALGNLAAVKSATSTAMLVAALVGLVLGLALLPFAPALSSLVRFDGALLTEGTRSFRLVLVSLPLLVLAPTLRGLLEALRRFPSLAVVRAVSGSLSFLAPAVALAWTTDLAALTLVTLGVRLLETAAYYVLVALERGLRRQPGSITRSKVRELFAVGGWMSISNAIAPLLLQFDRFLVGNLLSLSAVAYYATPQSMVSRLQLIPRSIMAVLFPEFSRSIALDGSAVQRLSQKASKVMVGVMLLPCLTIFVGAEWLLNAWLGPDFAQYGATATRLLAVGVLIHSLGQVPFALLQAAGHSRLTAMVHLVEAPAYVAYLYLLTVRFGINGTALAWVIRVTISTLVLFFASRRIDFVTRQPKALTP